MRSWLNKCCEVLLLSSAVKGSEKLIRLWGEHELIVRKEKVLFESNTLAFAAKATLRTRHPAASFRMHVFGFLISWGEMHQTGGNWGKGLCQHSKFVIHQLVHGSTRRHLSWCEGRGYVATLYIVLCAETFKQWHNTAVSAQRTRWSDFVPTFSTVWECSNLNPRVPHPS